MATVDSKDYLLVNYYDDGGRKNLPSTWYRIQNSRRRRREARIRRFVRIFRHDEFVFSLDSFWWWVTEWIEIQPTNSFALECVAEVAGENEISTSARA